MSAVANQTALTKDRTALSTQRLCEALGLGVVAAKNFPYLTIALMEAATQEIRYNPAFRQRIQLLYQEALPPVKAPPVRTTPSRQGSARATGSSRAGSGLAPGAAPDLRDLREHFTPAEWKEKLSKFNKEPLRKAVDQLPEHYPDAKPNSKAGKEALVTYLLTYMSHM